MLKMCENCDCRHWSISDSPCQRCTCESHWQLSWSWAKKQLHQYLGLLTSAYGLYWQIFDLYDGSKSSIQFGTEPLPKSDSLYLGPQVKINWEEVEDFDDLVRKLTEYIIQDVVGTGHEEKCVSDAERKKERFQQTVWDLDVDDLYPKTIWVKNNPFIPVTPWMLSKNMNIRKYFVPEINKVIYSGPATIVFWSDDTKTVVKAQNGDKFDPEKGLAMAIAKKALGNDSRYYDVFKKWENERRKAIINSCDKVYEYTGLKCCFMCKHFHEEPVSDYCKGCHTLWDNHSNFIPAED